MKTATQINDILEAIVNFCREPNDNETPMLNTKHFDHIQLYQNVTIPSILLFGDNKAKSSPNKFVLIKKEGSFVNEFGIMPITL